MTGSILQMRRQRQVQHLHQLGARAVAELLTALATEADADAVLDRLLGEFYRISPAQVRTAGGDQWPVRVRRVA